MKKKSRSHEVMSFLVVFEMLDGEGEGIIRIEVVENVKTKVGHEHTARRKLLEEHLSQGHIVKLISRREQDLSA